MNTAGDAISALVGLRNDWLAKGLDARVDAIDSAIGHLVRKEYHKHEPADLKAARAVMMRMREHYLKLGRTQDAGVFYRAAHLLDTEAA